MQTKIRIKFILLILLLFTGIVTTTVTVRADNTTTEEYQDDNGSLQDTMRNWGNTNKPDDKIMKTTGGWITKTAGTIISVIIWIIFALMAFTTACDLMYIALPATRTFLDKSSAGSKYGYSSYTRQSADEAYAQGDYARANQLYQSANNIEASGVGIAHTVGNNSKQDTSNSLISRELRSLVAEQMNNNGQDANFQATTGQNLMSNTKLFILEYFKRRAVVIVITVVIMILLLGTSIFTDFGLNFGQFVLDKLGFL